MILVLRDDCSASEIQQTLGEIRALGLKDSLIQSHSRTLISIDSPGCDQHRPHLEQYQTIEWIIPTATNLPSKEATQPQCREISLFSFSPKSKSNIRRDGIQNSKYQNDGTLGGRQVGIIAGPCSVESREQLLEIAHAVQEAGGIALRGGAFKPRTNPYSFQGLGERALEFLAEARNQTGLAIVTEVMSIEQVSLVAQYADVLQIGTRNMHNFNLLSAVGKSGKPVLLKRGWSASLDEFLHAAEYIINEGNPNVILCERGIRTFETYVRNTLPLAMIPAVKQRSPLPIVVDPSQGTGVADYVPAMSKAALAAGADGLLIEVHRNPSQAITDGDQTLNLQQFAQLMQELQSLAVVLGRSIG